MDKTPLADEQPKQKVAAKVITEKRLYFLPDTGQVYMAKSVDDAIAKSRAEDKKATNKKDEKVGDAN